MFQSINPKNGKILSKIIPFMSRKQLDAAINTSYKTFLGFRDTHIHDRLHKISNLRKNLEQNLDIYAQTMTDEMGKPILQARAEINKCATHCLYYEENSEKILQSVPIQTEADN